jgi:DNA primase catalytic subunit
MATSTAVALVERLLQSPQVRDIYFCLSRQRAYKLDQSGKPAADRSKENAVALKSLWLDIDVKDPPKGYASVGEALAAQSGLCHSVGLPEPSAIVLSGGGIHVYWSSARVLTPDEWQPLAQGLKNAAVQHGLRCDVGCTTDRARLLRVPGTFNWKGGQKRPVKLLRLGECYEF